MASRKLSPGDPIRFPAAEWNRHVEASDAYHERRALGEGSLPRRGFQDLGTIKVKNTTGEDLARGSVVEVGSKIIDQLHPEYLWFEGKKPTRSDHRALAILRRPIPAGSIDLAQVAGVCLARVNVTQPAHRYAWAKKDETVLQSGHAGNFLLVQPPENTGTQELPVVLGAQAQGASLRRLAKLDGELSQGGSAPMTFLEFQDGSLVATGQTDTVHDYWLNTEESVEADTKILAEWMGGLWIAAEMYCAKAEPLPPGGS